jgi:hypothetical protein
MKRIFLAVVFTLLSSAPSYASPSLHVDNLQYDFGVVTQEGKAEHVFEIVNKGDGDLVIEKLTPS